VLLLADELDGYVQPASIDLPLAGEAWLVKEKVLPFRKRVRELIDVRTAPPSRVSTQALDVASDAYAQSLALEKCSLGGDGAMLLRGQTYLVHCGSISLPADHRGLLSPKSSIGTDNRLF